mmetsp:Transcript_92893/g.139428  ORF Transcript_92893/g.139428 Transcript_92893/m.139428 type:complete len:376 (-) Transcript_92893:232-1359(-)
MGIRAGQVAVHGLARHEPLPHVGVGESVGAGVLAHEPGLAVGEGDQSNRLVEPQALAVAVHQHPRLLVEVLRVLTREMHVECRALYHRETEVVDPSVKLTLPYLRPPVPPPPCERCDSVLVLWCRLGIRVLDDALELLLELRQSQRAVPLLVLDEQRDLVPNALAADSNVALEVDVVVLDGVAAASGHARRVEKTLVLLHAPGDDTTLAHRLELLVVNEFLEPVSLQHQRRRARSLVLGRGPLVAVHDVVVGVDHDGVFALQVHIRLPPVPEPRALVHGAELEVQLALPSVLGDELLALLLHLLVLVVLKQRLHRAQELVARLLQRWHGHGGQAALEVVQRGVGASEHLQHPTPQLDMQRHLAASKEHVAMVVEE